MPKVQRSVAAPDRWKSRLLTSFQHGKASPGNDHSDDRLQVLVVDDNEVNRVLVMQILRHLGAVPTQAFNGAEGVELACELEFDLVLMDLNMPLVSGLSAIKQIRRFERQSLLARVPIIIYSSPAWREGLDQLQRVGADGTLAKPCTAQAMSDCLRRFCPQPRLSKREFIRS